MAEEQECCRDSCQQQDELKKEETLSVNESKPMDGGSDVQHHHTDDTCLSSTPANGEGPDDGVPADPDSTEGGKFGNSDITTAHQAGDESRHDCKRESQKEERTSVTIPERSSSPSAHTENTTRNETDQDVTSQNPAKMEKEEEEMGEEEVDGPKAEIDEEPSTKDTNSEPGKDVLNTSEEETDKEENSSHSLLQPRVFVVEKTSEQKSYVETIGPTMTEGPESAFPEIWGGSRRFLIAVVMVVLVAVLVKQLLLPGSPPPNKELRQIDIFLKKMEKVQSRYPNQRAELWNRSRIHLKRHLQITQPTEPVSLILTAGLRAERTLRCLAQSLAHAFSSALNASVLHIDGASKASQDSDQVKLDIDSNLQRAFEGDKPVAVIHRFEELPPGSTLIFYRYCDHENAAYKKTFLIFTVLLAEEEEISAETQLSAVEEMVDDHLQRRFLSHDHPVSFDSMDLDKYGGLWSRISHLILPVAAEERTESEGC